MSTPCVPPKELLDLLAVLADGDLSDEQEGRLAELLRGDREARACYLDHVALLTSLQWEYPASAVGGEPEQPAVRLLRPWRTILQYAAVAAVAALLTFAVARWSVRGPVSVATLTHLEDVRGSAARFSVGQRLAPGPLVLESGLASFRLDGGATVMVSGPAELEIESAETVRLKSGRVRVRAPREASGFTLKTPASDFIDLGTEFGVEVKDETSAELHVFEGVVIARPTASDLVVPVLGKEAARVEAERGDVVAVAPDPARFPRPAPERVPPLPSARFAPLPAGARVVFLGDRATDRESHLLLIDQALAGLPRESRPRLFNAGIALPLSFTERDFQSCVQVRRPTHAVLEFGPEIAATPQPRSPDQFEADVTRLLDRLAKEQIEPILETGYPVTGPHGQAGQRLDTYNRVLRDLAARRALRLADAEQRFRALDPSGTELLAGNGLVPTFEGHRQLAAVLLESLGHAGLAVPGSLRLAPLPGVLRQWRIRTRPAGERLDAAAVAQLEPDAGWTTLTLPQPEDQLLRRLADRSHSITYRDRARGFATDLHHDRGRDVEAVAVFDSDQERPVYLHAGATLQSVWLNGVKVIDLYGRWTGWHAGKVSVPARLKAGRNTIVVEAHNSFFLSVTDSADWTARGGDE